MLRNFFSALIFSQNKGELLYLAIQSGDEEKVSHLLSKVGDFNSINSTPNTKKIHPLILAAPYPNILSKIIDKYHVQISISDLGYILNRVSKKGYSTSTNILIEKYGNAISNKRKGEILCRSARNNQIAIIDVLLKQCSCDISTSDKIRALRFAAKNAHLEAIDILLQNSSVTDCLNDPWQRQTPLYEAKIQYQIAKNKQEKTRYQTIIDRLMQIPAIALFESIRKKTEKYFIKPDIKNNLFDNVTEKIKKLDDKILKYLLQEIAFQNSLDEYDFVNPIKLNDDEKKNYYDIFTFSAEQANHFLKETASWKNQENIEERYNQLKTMGNELPSEKYSFYATFSVFCLRNPLYAFAPILYQSASKQLNKSEKPITYSYENAFNSKNHINDYPQSTLKKSIRL